MHIGDDIKVLETEMEAFVSDIISVEVGDRVYYGRYYNRGAVQTWIKTFLRRSPTGVERINGALGGDFEPRVVSEEEVALLLLEADLLEEDE